MSRDGAEQGFLRSTSRPDGSGRSSNCSNDEDMARGYDIHSIRYRANRLLQDHNPDKMSEAYNCAPYSGTVPHSTELYREVGSDRNKNVVASGHNVFEVSKPTRELSTVPTKSIVHRSQSIEELLEKYAPEPKKPGILGGISMTQESRYPRPEGRGPSATHGVLTKHCSHSMVPLTLREQNLKLSTNTDYDIPAPSSMRYIENNCRGKGNSRGLNTRQSDSYIRSTLYIPDKDIHDPFLQSEAVFTASVSTGYSSDWAVHVPEEGPNIFDNVHQSILGFPKEDALSKVTNSNFLSHEMNVRFKSNSATNLSSGVTQPTPPFVLSDHISKSLSSVATGSLDTAKDKLQEYNTIGDFEEQYHKLPHYKKGKDYSSLDSTVSESVSCSSPFLKTKSSLESSLTADSGHCSSSNYLQPEANAEGTTSRKSSSSDSAIDMRPHLSEDGQICSTPSGVAKPVSYIKPDVKAANTDSCPVYPSEPMIDNLMKTSPRSHSKSRSRYEEILAGEVPSPEKSVLHRSDSKDSNASNGSERSKSPRFSFCKAQTPSFTKLIHPPSVVISDHSNEDAANKTTESDKPISQPATSKTHSLPKNENLETLTIRKSSLERKLSDASTSSDFSDSTTKSFLSDSSYSMDDEDYDIDIRRNLPISVSGLQN